MIQHRENDHWAEWRDAVKRDGYNATLACAARCLMEIDGLTPEAFENLTAGLFQQLEFRQ